MIIYYLFYQWNKVQSAKFIILEHQMDPSSNFSSYRSTLKAAMWRSVNFKSIQLTFNRLNRLNVNNSCVCVCVC